MPSASDPRNAAWDRLLTLIEHLATQRDVEPPEDLENQFAGLCEEGARDGSIDRELHAIDTARWLVGLLAAHQSVRSNHPEVASDDDLAYLLVIATRWLHPARLAL